MSLEYLTAPLPGPLLRRRRRRVPPAGHLDEAMLFLPYGVAIDHFQHLVYANPDGPR